MLSLRIRLFGKFEVQQDDQIQTGAWTRRAQELLSYLILHRHKPHPREALIDTLWSDCPPAQSRKQLRQVLWEMQTALHTRQSETALLDLAETDWIALNSQCAAWFDVDEFEKTCGQARHIPGDQLELECARALQHAVELYRGDLLEGWYQDWCLYERERLQNLYLDTLDKLIVYCTVQQDYEAGLEYGAQILRYDRARERTHGQMMRLHYAANDRAGALRQFQRCVAALDQELGVKPSRRTLDLYEQIRADRVPEVTTGRSASPPSVITRLKSLQVTLIDLQRQVERELQALEQSGNE